MRFRPLLELFNEVVPVVGRASASQSWRLARAVSDTPSAEQEPIEGAGGDPERSKGEDPPTPYPAVARPRL
jgi:hypothetical protein